MAGYMRTMWFVDKQEYCHEGRGAIIKGMQKAHTKNHGFTIVELLIVIVVIGILAGVSVVAYSGISNRARRATLESEMSNTIKKIELAKVNNGDTYPNSVTDCPTPTNGNLCLSGNGVSYRYRSITGPGMGVGYGSIISAPAYEISVEGDSQFLYSSNAEATRSNEFLQYMDMAPLIDKYGPNKKYLISLEIKAPVAGNVNMYMQNGSDSRYYFSIGLPVTSSYTKHSVVVTPSGPNSSVANSILAFYGTYGTGRVPSVKNVQISLAP